MALYIQTQSSNILPAPTLPLSPPTLSPSFSPLLSLDSPLTDSPLALTLLPPPPPSPYTIVHLPHTLVNLPLYPHPPSPYTLVHLPHTFVHLPLYPRPPPLYPRPPPPIPSSTSLYTLVHLPPYPRPPPPIPSSTHRECTLFCPSLHTPEFGSGVHAAGGHQGTGGIESQTHNLPCMPTERVVTFASLCAP